MSALGKLTPPCFQPSPASLLAIKVNWASSLVRRYLWHLAPLDSRVESCKRQRPGSWCIMNNCFSLCQTHGSSSLLALSSRSSFPSSSSFLLFFSSSLLYFISLPVSFFPPPFLLSSKRKPAKQRVGSATWLRVSEGWHPFLPAGYRLLPKPRVRTSTCDLPRYCVQRPGYCITCNSLYGYF